MNFQLLKYLFCFKKIKIVSIIVANDCLHDENDKTYAKIKNQTSST